MSENYKQIGPFERFVLEGRDQADAIRMEFGVLPPRREARFQQTVDRMNSAVFQRFGHFLSDTDKIRVSLVRSNFIMVKDPYEVSQEFFPNLYDGTELDYHFGLLLYPHVHAVLIVDPHAIWSSLSDDERTTYGDEETVRRFGSAINSFLVQNHLRVIAHELGHIYISQTLSTRHSEIGAELIARKTIEEMSSIKYQGGFGDAVDQLLARYGHDLYAYFFGKADARKVNSIREDLDMLKPGIHST